VFHVETLDKMDEEQAQFLGELAARLGRIVETSDMDDKQRQWVQSVSEREPAKDSN